MRRVLTLFFTALLAMALLGGCGNGLDEIASKRGGPPPEGQAATDSHETAEELAAAAERSNSARTGRFTGTMDMTLSYSIEGEFAGPDSHYFLDLTELTGASVEYIWFGGEMYMRFPGVMGEAGLDADSWLSVFGSSGGASSGQPPISANGYLGLLEQTSAEVTEVGEEEIDGVDTTHYHAELEIEALLGQSSSDQVESLFGGADLGVSMPEVVPIDVWIGADGYIWQMEMEWAMQVMGEDVNYAVSFDYFDYGADIVIEPPDPSLVVDDPEIIEEIMNGGPVD